LSKVPTGITIADDLLGGGIERGGALLFRGSPLVDVTMVTIQALYNRLRDGDVGIYFTNAKSPSCVMEEADGAGISLRRFKDEGRLSFIDAFSGIFGMKSEEEYHVETPSDADLVSKVVSRAIREKAGRGKAVIVYDSLNTSLDEAGEGVLRQVEEWNRIALVHDAIIFYAYTEWGYPTKTSERIADIFPSIVDLRTLERIVASQVLTVSKQGGKTVKKKLVPIKVAVTGGIVGYIPKIVVTGPLQVGKTTLVHTLSTRAVSVQRMGITIALDFGHVVHRGLALDLFGTIGHERFDPILTLLGGDALGVILVLDSTKPEGFPRAKEMMRKTGVLGLPYVIAANKQDLPGALSAEEIRRRMNVPEEVVIIGTVGTDKASVMKVLDALIDKIMTS